MPAPKDPEKRKLWIEHMSIARKGKKCPEHSLRMSGSGNPSFGKTGNRSPRFGTHPIVKIETRLKISLATKNRKCPWAIERNKRISVRENNSIKMRGRTRTLKSRLKQAATISGENSHLWRGGVSFEPYCPKFNKRFKKRVRAHYKYVCVKCKRTTEENGRELDVHHVNFDKQTCCKSGEKISDQKFVALCKKCHSYATNHPIWAIEYYTKIIDDNYCGKSYLTEEEYIKTETQDETQIDCNSGCR